MLPLSPNPETGFLESNRGSSFDSATKVRFLDLCRTYKRKTGKWPDVGSVCDEVGISVRAFEEHLIKDEVFKSEWDELTLRGEATLTSLMFDQASKNPMYMFGWLRRWNPTRWNPEQKLIVSADYVQLKGSIDSAEKVFEAEIVPNHPTIAPRCDEKH